MLLRKHQCCAMVHCPVSGAEHSAGIEWNPSKPSPTDPQGYGELMFTCISAPLATTSQQRKKKLQNSMDAGDPMIKKKILRLQLATQSWNDTKSGY